MNREEIDARLDAVDELKTHTVLREEIRHNLAGVQDLERLAGRVTLGVASPRDLLGLRQSLTRVPLLRKYLANCRVLAPRRIARADGRTRPTFANASNPRLPMIRLRLPPTRASSGGDITTNSTNCASYRNTASKSLPRWKSASANARESRR